ncbi:MAG: ABC transporter permease [Acidimicrobiia bacterium]
MSFPEYLADRWPEILRLAADHARVVGVAVAAASVLGVGLAVATSGHRWAAAAATRAAATIFTVPSFALFGLLIPLLGLGYAPTVVTLVVYALLPILRNSIAGLRSVDPAVVEVATGMGLGRWRRLRHVELPLAWPVILAGIRVATLLSIGIAAIAAVVNGPGLGNHILRGLAQVGGARAADLALGGTLGIIGLALVADACFVLLRRVTTSRGIRT